MKLKKIQYWSTVHDDQLELVDKTTVFLQGEFCLEGADKLWSPEYFIWKLGDSNPAGKGYMSLAVENGQVVGSISLTKKRLLINGKECLGGEIGDSYTSTAIKRRGRPSELSTIDPNPKSYKNKSIFGRLASEVRSRAESDGVSIIYGTPNKYSHPGYIKNLDYLNLQDYVNKSYFRPTSKLLIKEYPALKKIHFLLRGLELFSIAFQKFIYTNLLGRGITFDTSLPDYDEINQLWTRTKPRRGFSLVRDAAYWKHRYVEHPLASYSFFSVRKNGCLIGLSVTRLFSSEKDKSSISVVEWMTDNDVKFEYALSLILDFYKNSGVDFYYLWAQESSKEAIAALKNLFILKRNAPIIIANTKDAQFMRSSSKDINFYLGSSDAI